MRKAVLLMLIMLILGFCLTALVVLFLVDDLERFDHASGVGSYRPGGGVVPRGRQLSPLLSDSSHPPPLSSYKVSEMYGFLFSYDWNSLPFANNTQEEIKKDLLNTSTITFPLTMTLYTPDGKAYSRRYASLADVPTISECVDVEEHFCFVKYETYNGGVQ